MLFLATGFIVFYNLSYKGIWPQSFIQGYMTPAMAASCSMCDDPWLKMNLIPVVYCFGIFLCSLIYVIPKYLKFVIFFKDLLTIFMLCVYHMVCWWGVNMYLVAVAFTLELATSLLTGWFIVSLSIGKYGK